MKYTGTQVQGRLLLHSFSAAAAYAQQRYGVRYLFIIFNLQKKFSLTYFFPFICLTTERREGTSRTGDY